MELRSTGKHGVENSSGKKKGARVEEKLNVRIREKEREGESKRERETARKRGMMRMRRKRARVFPRYISTMPLVLKLGHAF